MNIAVDTIATSPSSDAAKAGAVRQYVTFLVDDSVYGVDIKLVREIKQWTATTVLPNQPAHTKGVLNLRGTIVPVHDLRARFGGPLTEPTENHVVVIVWIGTKTVGILVDAVSDIIGVPSDEIRPAPSADGEPGGGDATIWGLVSAQTGMVALLDLNTMFPSDEGDIG
ncbi:chemotaxis protein CheW [Oceanibium sediminis]|uniref:chemotaxis protein CheW n=1 Tax=Oceanibium sediminis TaxID=2026339 RepID=UPI0018E571D6|nr:chemotaxis protein CheW [Oceanibium sediminis]